LWQRCSRRAAHDWAREQRSRIMKWLGHRLLATASSGIARQVRRCSGASGGAAPNSDGQAAGAGAPGELNEEMQQLLAAVACPLTKTPLRYDSARQVCGHNVPKACALGVVSCLGMLRLPAGVPPQKSRRSPTERAGGGQVLISDEAKLEFPIVNGIPNLKPDAGVPKRS
jgi:uncharacterized protein YbaR (Trm112 family)